MKSLEMHNATLNTDTVTHSLDIIYISFQTVKSIMAWVLRGMVLRFKGLTIIYELSVK